MKLGPNRRHFFQLEGELGRSYTHVKVTIYPGAVLAFPVTTNMDLTCR